MAVGRTGALERRSAAGPRVVRPAASAGLHDRFGNRGLIEWLRARRRIAQQRGASERGSQLAGERVLASGTVHSLDGATTAESVLQESFDASVPAQTDGSPSASGGSAADSAVDNDKITVDAPAPSGDAGSSAEDDALAERLRDATVDLPAAAAVDEELRDAIGPGNDEELPETQRSRFTFKEFKGRAFVKGKGDADAVDPNDVKQGELGDCYLHAALLAVARARPALIRRMIRERENGTFDVELYFDDHILSLSPSPQLINVVPTFPVRADGTPGYAQEGDMGRRGPELWVMLIEKAWAIRHGGYDKIPGGVSSTVFDAIDGGESHSHLLFFHSYESILKVIHAALARKEPVTASTKSRSGDRGAEMDTLKIAPNHVYAPKSVDLERWSIDLTNPHGTKDTYPDIVRLHGSVFLRLFDRVDVMKGRSASIVGRQ